MSNTRKPEALIRAFRDNMKSRLPSSYLISDAPDANGKGWTLSIAQDSSWATGEFKAVLRVLGMDSQFKDSIGLSQTSYGPHKAQLILEESAVSGSSVLSWLNESKLIAELSRMGIRMELFLSANGTEPALSMFASSGAVTTAVSQGSIDPDLHWPLSGQ